MLINLNNPRHQSRLLVIGVVIAVLTARLMDLLTVNNLVTNQIKNGALIIIGMGFLLAVYFSYRMKNGKYSRLAHKIPTKVQLITISFLLLLIIFMKQVILVIVSIPLTAQYTAITILMAAVIGSLAIIWREEE